MYNVHYKALHKYFHTGMKVPDYISYKRGAIKPAKSFSASPVAI